jgi:hypothetical protein
VNPGDLVIAQLRDPREQLWGLLTRLDNSGVIIRGIDMACFEEWSSQCAAGGEQALGPSTVFIPTHRIERISLDEPVGAVPSLGRRFRDVTDRDPADFLSPPDNPQ